MSGLGQIMGWNFLPLLCCRPYLFQTVNSVRTNNLILKYQRFTTLQAELKDFETQLKFETEPKHGWGGYI